MQILVENLNYVYNPNSKLSVSAIKDISFSLKGGDFLGVIGHTGSGKSTLIKHLNALIKPQKNSGKVTVGEFDLTDKKCDFKSLRQKVGMVFQYPEYQLFAETVYDDVAFGLKNFGKYSEEEIYQKVKEALETVGLNFDEVKNKSPFELSGGQKRRVAIAGVIVNKPEVLVLDEPVAGLDPEGKREFISLIKTLRQKYVKIVIIVSHDMNIVAENCNKVAILNRGELAFFGSVKEAFTSAEKITELGLKLPLTASLSETLKKSGINLNTDYTLGDFVKKVAEYKGGGL